MKINTVFDKHLLQELGIKHYYSLDLAKSPHIMTVGGTGSGKTFLNKFLIARISMGNAKAKITVLDFKADDYHFARDAPRLFEFDRVLDGLDTFYAEFLSRQQGSNPDRSFRLLVIEELGSMLSYFDKKTSDEIKTKLANMIFMGRSFNIHLLVSTQRPDASYFNSGVRDSINIIFALGSLSKEGKNMLFPGFQEETKEPQSQGSGFMLVDGANLHSIIVPRITNTKRFEEIIKAGLSD